MTIPIDEKSIVKEYDRSEDFIVDAQDNEHIRIMKMFPLCHEREEIKLDDYRRFHCRFYLPRAKVLDKNNKIDRLILIINGLNEKYFTLYDQLGRGLSHYGIASVLLPLPNHLNRHSWFRHKDPKKTLDTFNPSDYFMQKPPDFFKLYMQMVKEMLSLVNHINGRECGHQFYNDCQFFDAYFEKKIRISILGYSLGGLGALSMFLSKPELFNACFLINSGVNLGDINPGKMISPELWKEFISKFWHFWEEEFHNHQNDPFSKLFNQIFVGDSSILFKETISPFTERILLIHGGADSTMPYDSITKIEPKEFGLSIFKVPGLKHFLPIDPEWDRWFPFVIRLVDQFEERATSQQWTRHDLINKIIKYQKKYFMFVSPSNCDTDRITDLTEKRQFEELMYIARAYYQNIGTLILEVFLTLERDNYTKITESHDSMLCRLAEKAKYIKHDSLIKVLIKQVELSKIEKFKKSGEIMMDLNMITQEQLKHLINQQKRMRN